MKARIEQPDNRLAAVALWAYSYRYSKFGVAMPETVVQCAEKAAFSQHTISDEEIASSRAAYADMLQSAAQQLKLPQRLYLQFLRGLR